MSKIVGLTRASTELQVDSPEVQMSQILEGAEHLGLKGVVFAHEALGCSGVKTVFRKRPEGRRLWVTLGKGDVLIVAKLDRLGRNTRDVVSTVNHFIEHGVRIVILDFLGGQGIDLAGPVGQIIVTVMAACAELEASNIAARTKAHFAWAKQQGFATNKTHWGMKKVPTDLINGRGKIRNKLEWDLEFLKLMAEFIHRVRCGEKVSDLIFEFRANHVDWQGKPFLAAYGRDGKLLASTHDSCITKARKWMRSFVTLLHKGDLPRPFGVPGVGVPVDRGMAENALLWMDEPNFVASKHASPKRPRVVNDDRSGWTAEQWRIWWAEMNSDGTHKVSANIEAEVAEIKAKTWHWPRNRTNGDQ
jgi:DNA invertase Pin-like site-specific DNA recombinase